MARSRRTLRWLSRLLLLVVLAVAVPGGVVLPLTAPPPENPKQQEETVAFNTKTLKFHCKTCQWATKCTVNCVDVSRSEAIRRGGVGCKVCKGTCGK
jgi:hypothetical protein